MSTDEDQSPPPRRRPFFKPYERVRLSPDQARRQGQITHLAHVLLGREVAMSFLNTNSASLGARPLDLAMASAEGYGAVESAVRLLARPTLGRSQ